MSVAEKIKHKLYPYILSGEKEVYVHCAIELDEDGAPLATDEELEKLVGKWEIFFDMNEGIGKGLVIGRGSPLSGWATLVDVSNMNNQLAGERSFSSAKAAMEWIKESVMIQEMISSYRSRIQAEEEERLRKEANPDPVPVVEAVKEPEPVVKNETEQVQDGERSYSRAEVMDIIQFLRPDLNPHNPLLKKIL